MKLIIWVIAVAVFTILLGMWLLSKLVRKEDDAA